ncbi:MAG: carbohydrate ABC transporter substrate-binding protein [Anaerolineae bacterium]|nr:carbohydrate ABC transporter substrate-binding protein [Anaerolineae bacterium]
MKQKTFAFLAFVTMLLLLAGCTAEPATIVVTKEVEVAGETIIETVEVDVEKNIVIYNSMQGDPEPRAADEYLVSLYEEQNPDVDVVHSIVAHEDFKQAIRAYLTASTPPDVLTWFAGNRARFFIDKGQIMDISDVWEDEGWNEDFPPGFKALATVDGKQYFLPTSYYWWGIYYSKSIFEEYGLEEPQTWEELLDVCETLKSNDVAPFTIGTKYRWTAAAWFDYINMRINGPEFHINLMLGTESYTDPRVKTVFTDYWAPLIENGYFIDNPAAYTWQEAIQFMVDGNAAMYLMGGFIRDSYPEELQDDLAFFQFPIIDPAVPIGEDAPTDGYFIAANAQNVEEAKALLAFFGSAEVQQYYADELGRLPVHMGVDASGFTAEQQQGIKMIQGADYVAQFYDRDTTPEMADEGMNGFMEFWDTPGSIDKILERLEEVRQELFEAETE